MISLRFKRRLFAAGVLCAVGFTVWPGCILTPLPSSRHPLSSLKSADFSQRKNTMPTRNEIDGKLGKPDEYFPDLHVACYKLNRLSRHKVLLLFGVLPVSMQRDLDRLEVGLIHFDDQGRALRMETVIVSGYDSLHYSAQKWLAAAARDSH